MILFDKQLIHQTSFTGKNVHQQMTEFTQSVIQAWKGEKQKQYTEKKNCAKFSKKIKNEWKKN